MSKRLEFLDIRLRNLPTRPPNPPPPGQASLFHDPCLPACHARYLQMTYSTLHGCSVRGRLVCVQLAYRIVSFSRGDMVWAAMPFLSLKGTNATCGYREPRHCQTSTSGIVLTLHIYKSDNFQIIDMGAVKLATLFYSPHIVAPLFFNYIPSSLQYSHRKYLAPPVGIRM